MSTTIHISQIMTDKVIVANQKNTFSQLTQFFTDAKIQHLPVTFDDKLIGIISIFDMMKFVSKHMNDGGTLDKAALDAAFDLENEMTRNPITLHRTDVVDTAIKILSEGKFQALPVVEEGYIRGIVTNKDLVRFHLWEKENL